MMESLFVTGVGGFIGLRLAQRCLERGVRVSGIDVSPAAVERARALGVSATLGDINDEAGLRVQMRGVHTVVHTAAIVKEVGTFAEFERVNVRGSRSVAEAAKAQGVRAFVQLSSVMVYGFDFPPEVGEVGPLRGEGNPYCQTKIDSERAVRALQDDTFGVIVIRPGDVYGPGSVPWIARPLSMLRKRQLVLPANGRGMINHVFIDNLVDGILLALSAEAYGETFNISDGVAVTYAEYFGLLAQRAGLPGPISLPTSAMRALVGVMMGLARLGLSHDELSFDTVRTLLRPNVYSIAKARDLLGYAPAVSLHQGLARCQEFIDSESAQATARARR